MMMMMGLFFLSGIQGRRHLQIHHHFPRRCFSFPDNLDMVLYDYLSLSWSYSRLILSYLSLFRVHF